MTYVLIPLKRLDKSKTRLSSVLTLEERVELTIAMLEDVVESAVHAKGVKRVYVINNDVELARIMKAHGVKMLRDPGKGLNNALKIWLKKFERESKSALILPADIPLIKSEDLEQVIRLGAHYDMVISPSRNMKGTNALLLKPPTLLKPLFGSNSFNRHLKAAVEVNVRLKVFKNERIGFDVDSPSDLKTLLSTQDVHRNVKKLMEKFDHV
ncbi:MAG: 2-phospho-L-lactate guanylyltransferase [Candidatus Bathyarchaeia archaeon]